MYEILANPHTPALTVLVILVFAFLGFLRFAFKAIGAMAEEGMKVIDHNTEALEDNSKIQGQVLEALRRSNGHTTLEAVNEDAL